MSFSSFKIPKKDKPRDEKAAPSLFTTSKDAPPKNVDAFNVEDKQKPLQTNMFDLNVSSMPEIIQRISFETTLVVPKRDGPPREFHLNTGVVVTSASAAQHVRRLGQIEIFRTVCRQSKLFGSNLVNLAYDGAGTVYAPNGIYTGGAEPHSINLKLDDFAPEQMDAVKALVRCKNFHFTVKVIASGFVYRNKLDDPGNVSELTRLIEVVTDQVISSPVHYRFGNCTFNIDPRKSQEACSESATREDRKGFLKSTRLCDNKFSLVIDMKTSPFHKSMPLIEFMLETYKAMKTAGDGRGSGSNQKRKYPEEQSSGSAKRHDRGDRDDRGYGRDRSYQDRDRDRRDRGDSRSRDYQDRDRDRSHRDRRGEQPRGDESKKRDVGEMAKYLQSNKTALEEMSRAIAKLTVRATHIQRNVTIHGLSTSNAANTFFELREGDAEPKKINIVDYFLDKYALRLAHKDLNLVVSKGCKTPTYYPVELLEVLPGQRVKNVVPPNETLPSKRLEYIAGVLNHDLRMRGNAHIEAFGIRLGSPRPKTIQGKQLSAPALSDGLTSHGSNSFAKPKNLSKAAVTQKVGVINFDDCFNETQLVEFCKRFVTHARRKAIGTDFSEWRLKTIRRGDNAELKKRLEQRDTNIIIVIAKEKKPEVHDVLKLFEAATGIPTMQLCLETAKKIMSDGRNASTTENVLRKFNVKAGGINFELKLSPKVCTQTEYFDKKLLKGTQFVAFEMAHGGSRTLYDRMQCQFDGEPTVVGCSYSLGSTTDLGGFNFLQTQNEYKLRKISEKMPEVLRAYQTKSKVFPEKLVIYRVGVGEGDIPRVKEEIEEMRSAISGLQKQPIKMCVIIAQKSLVRLFPGVIKGNKASEQNVSSGTCVDAEVVGRNEFILVGQCSGLGTARPTKYTVLCNELEWSMNELTNITYSLCHGHQVSGGPTAVPHVLYAAQNLAKRGRNNWKVARKLENISDITHKVLEKYGMQPEGDEMDGDIVDALNERINKMTITTNCYWA